ncbi:MAG: hypothetical protein ACI9OU_002634 [Candidatus Promineifilaceae bacterium]|jgi:hypothetical protein
MLRFRTTLFLFVAVCTVGLVILLVERDRQLHEKRHVQKEKVFPFKAEDVTSLQILRSSNVFECVKQDGGWFIQHPVKSRGDVGVIEGLLSKLELLRPLELITEEQRSIRGLDLMDYGLAPARIEIIVRNDTLERRLLIGDHAPLGDWVYTKLARFPEVISLPKSLTELIPDNIGMLRDTRVFPRGPGKTTRIDIYRPAQGFVRLVREDARWALTQPISCQANAASVQALLTKLYSARVSHFVWDAPIATESPAPADGAPPEGDVALTTLVDSYGLAQDEAVVRIEVWSEDGLTSQMLTIGKDAEGHPGEVYATRRDVPSIYAVSTNVVEALSVSVDDLRSRRVVGLAPEDVDQISIFRGEQRLVMERGIDRAWSIRQPVEWKADRRAVEGLLAALDQWHVQGFVKPANTNAAVTALETPWCVITLGQLSLQPDVEPATTDASVGTEPVSRFDDRDRVVVGAAAQGMDHVFVESTETAGFAVIDSRLIRTLPDNPADPLNYRNREVLAIVAEDIHRISLVRNGRTQTVSRVETDAWLSTSSSNRVDLTAINDILLSVSDLRAVRIEAMTPDSLVPFGLDRSATQLTLGLRGDQGIQKSLLFGFRSRTDGVFTTVQGLDVVFAISHDVTATLTRDLLHSATPDTSVVDPE